MPVKFQPFRIFVEYHSQFLLVSSEIRTVGLGLKICIDRCRNWCILVFNPYSKPSITYSLRLEYNKKKIRFNIYLSQLSIYNPSVTNVQLMDISTQHCAEGKAKVSSFPFRCVGRISYILWDKDTSKMLLIFFFFHFISSRDMIWTIMNSTEIKGEHQLSFPCLTCGETHQKPLYKLDCHPA